MKNEIQYFVASSILKNNDRIFTEIIEVLINYSIPLYRLSDDDVLLGVQHIGEKEEHFIAALTVKYNDKYYCFNKHPKRRTIGHTYTLPSCDLHSQVNSTLSALKRLYNSV